MKVKVKESAIIDWCFNGKGTPLTGNAFLMMDYLNHNRGKVVDIDEIPLNIRELVLQGCEEIEK